MFNIGPFSVNFHRFCPTFFLLLKSIFLLLSYFCPTFLKHALDSLYSDTDKKNTKIALIDRKRVCLTYEIKQFKRKPVQCINFEILRTFLPYQFSPNTNAGCFVKNIQLILESFFKHIFY